ncbi:pentapeptide repeat-containing protein [Mixta tenebrionis]
MNDVTFRNCLLQGISFNALTFPHSVSFYDCRLRYVDFIRLDLQKAEFINNAFKECAFEECNLKNSLFQDSTFSDCEFRQTNLTRCDFSDTEGLDLNPLINTLTDIKLPQTAGNRILKRMKIFISNS